MRHCRPACLATGMAACLSAFTAGATHGETVWIPAEEFKPCGPMSLYALGRLLGHPWNYEAVLRACPPARDGAVSAEQIHEAGQRLGQKLSVVRINAQEIAHLTPCIVHLNADEGKKPHFCVIAEARDDRWLVIDPPRPTAWVNPGQLSKRWDGIAIVAASPQAARGRLFWMAGPLAFLAGVGLFFAARQVKIGIRRKQI